MEIRDLTAEELEAIQTVVDYDNKDRAADGQMTVADAINARVEDDVKHFLERAERIEDEMIRERFKKAGKTKRNKIKALLED